METKKEQVSIKVSAETKRKMEAHAQELGVNMSEYTRMKLEGLLDDSQAGAVKGKETKAKPADSESENMVNSTVFLRILSTKMDTTNELLEKLVESASTRSNEENDDIQELGAALLEQEERLKAEHAEAISKLEEKIKSENLVLKFSEGQRNLLSKLILFRKEKGKPNSDNVEDFIGWLLKEKVYGSWSGNPPGFDDDFKAAFPNFFTNE